VRSVRQTDSLRNDPSTIDHRIDYVLYEPDGASLTVAAPGLVGTAQSGA
jgi:hypothetical protein